jgi:hypothetical protein
MRNETVINVVYLCSVHPPVESRFWLFPVYAVLKLVVCTDETQLLKIANSMREVTVIIEVSFTRDRLRHEASDRPVL